MLTELEKEMKDALIVALNLIEKQICKDDCEHATCAGCKFILKKDQINHAIRQADLKEMTK
jgi:hypothetical protein